jgi:FkbM family methyltransferase
MREEDRSHGDIDPLTGMMAVIKHPSVLFEFPGGIPRMVSRYKELERTRWAHVQRDFHRANPAGLVKTRYFGIHVHSKPHQLSARVIESGDWEPVTTALFLRLLPECRTVVDVGANIGWYTLLSAPRALNVWAFEPERTNFELLQRSLRANGYTNVSAKQVAVSDHDGTIDLWLSGASAGRHSTVRRVGVSKVEVPCRSLDSMFPDENIGLLKIDVEGGEPQVLGGAAHAITERRLKYILMEWNFEAWKGHLDLLRPFEVLCIDAKTPFSPTERPTRRPSEGNLLLKLRDS